MRRCCDGDAANHVGVQLQARGPTAPRSAESLHSDRANFRVFVREGEGLSLLTFQSLSVVYIRTIGHGNDAWRWWRDEENTIQQATAIDIRGASHMQWVVCRTAGDYVNVFYFHLVEKPVDMTV